MKPTNQHIADKALQLFNENGFVNVRLQHIADKAFVSVGHLAYHFKNKDAIVTFLYEEMISEKEILLKLHRVVPLFFDLNQMLEQLFNHQIKYRFFYTDSLEITRAYPQVAIKHKQHILWQRMQLTFMIQFNIARYAMELKHGDAATVAKQLQRFIDNWLHDVLVDDEHPLLINYFLEDAWQLLSAYFSETGLLEFRQEVK